MNMMNNATNDVYSSMSALVSVGGGISFKKRLSISLVSTAKVISSHDIFQLPQSSFLKSYYEPGFAGTIQRYRRSNHNTQKLKRNKKRKHCGY